ncbi:hypothetical protein ACFFLZ_00820 [Photobacterium aphoticum]|uniref:Uncharacterized protein n=1 Tax=Photobacterium aphoticum TaxID=754436 RepID=A0A0J1GJB0_9GAMM|nr:hypothetical protein [Photobacterium aphoticum]KLU99802.1 hypothetical protein ABT58_15110 [Photobacterium aphoticum]PSU59512.1 hypothetical protein C9I90_03290 [Photobacterium aphoticum]GHA40121.1 hypothetical protein GCM10007086_11990 [Photobacterium aphoticum]
MYKGNWYDMMGKERRDLRSLKLDFETLDLAVDEAIHVLPEAKLIIKNNRLDFCLIAIEETKRMLICKK